MEKWHWKKYSSTSGIPDDAFVAGIVNSLPIFVGRAPYKICGLIVGELIPQVPGITIAGFPPGCAHRVYDFMEILCTSYPDDLIWVKANAKSLLSTRNLIEGGFEISGGEPKILYIGRIQNAARYRIGKVVGFNRGPNDALYYCNDQIKEVYCPNYEVLTFK